MATDAYVILDPIAKLGGNDFSEGCKEASIVFDADIEEITHARSDGWKEEVGKFKQATITFKFLANATRTTLDAYFWTNLASRVTFEIAHRNAAAAPGTPHFTGSLVINKAIGVSGAVGSVETYDFTFKSTATVTKVVA